MPDILDRTTAKRLGLKRYFTGKPCHRGHVDERWVSNFSCVGCLNKEKNRIRAAIWFNDHKERHALNVKRSYVRNKEKSLARSKKWYEDNRDHCLLMGKTWATNNKEKVNAATKKWRMNNPERRKQVTKKWTDANPEKVKELTQKRRARLRSAEGSFTASDLKRIYKMQNARCAYCRSKLNGRYEVDHIIPLIKGGSNYPNNIQLLCDKVSGNSCNQVKGAADPIDFARSLGRLL